MNKLNIVPIPINVAYQLISKHHYSRVMPKLTEVCYGGFSEEGDLLAVLTLGWGVRPLHTIKKLFPSLTTKDYWEIGKMCLVDELPRNSESYFISKIIKEVKKNYPEKKIIYTWADGIMGKPGYVYQASNFLYGGFIWTDTYITDKGEKVHPRTSQRIIRLNEDGKKRARPSQEQLDKANIYHYMGKQFRYAYFLRNEKELKNQSTVEWSINNYPKDIDLEWKIRTSDGWTLTTKPNYSTEYIVNKVKEKSTSTQMLMF